MKCLIIIFAFVAILAQVTFTILIFIKYISFRLLILIRDSNKQGTKAIFLGFTQLGPFQRSIVQGQHAVFNLCFPNGFPFPDAPPHQCYNEGFQGSISWRTGPCLPPIVNGKLVPPCQGDYVAISRYYNY